MNRAPSKAEMDAYLAMNAKREGVLVTNSGLQYEILKRGYGAKPDITSTVQVHYIGTKIDSTLFDTSYGKGKPAVFKVSEVIKGWTEALLLMNVGSKFRLVVPPSLAYGRQGAGKLIGPNEVLIFEVDLVWIQ